MIEIEAISELHNLIFVSQIIIKYYILNNKEYFVFEHLSLNEFFFKITFISVTYKVDRGLKYFLHFHTLL